MKSVFSDNLEITCKGEKVNTLANSFNKKQQIKLIIVFFTLFY